VEWLTWSPRSLPILVRLVTRFQLLFGRITRIRWTPSKEAFSTPSSTMTRTPIFSILETMETRPSASQVRLGGMTRMVQTFIVPIPIEVKDRARALQSHSRIRGIAACDVGSTKSRSARRGLQTESPSGEGLLVCCFA